MISTPIIIAIKIYEIKPLNKTHASSDKNTVIIEHSVKQNINIAHAHVARRAYFLRAASILYPMRVANCSINGTSRMDNANIKQTLVFINVGYIFRKISSLKITNPAQNNKTHKNIHMFLLRINEIPATANISNAKNRMATCFFNATNTTNGYAIATQIPKNLIIFINDFFNRINHVL